MSSNAILFAVSVDALRNAQTDPKGFVDTLNAVIKSGARFESPERLLATLTESGRALDTAVSVYKQLHAQEADKNSEQAQFVANVARASHQLSGLLSAHADNVRTVIRLDGEDSAGLVKLKDAVAAVADVEPNVVAAGKRWQIIEKADGCFVELDLYPKPGCKAEPTSFRWIGEHGRLENLEGLAIGSAALSDEALADKFVALHTGGTNIFGYVGRATFREILSALAGGKTPEGGSELAARIVANDIRENPYVAPEDVVTLTNGEPTEANNVVPFTAPENPASN